jgi:hypothetical protein
MGEFENERKLALHIRMSHLIVIVSFISEPRFGRIICEVFDQARKGFWCGFSVIGIRIG